MGYKTNISVNSIKSILGHPTETANALAMRKKELSVRFIKKNVGWAYPDIKWLTKEGESVMDGIEFVDKERAITYAQVEMCTMEGDNLLSFEVIER